MLVVDTSIIIAIILNEPHKPNIIKKTNGRDLVAPPSLHWEIGNAFSAILKRKRITPKQIQRAIDQYQKIPIQYDGADLKQSVELANHCNIYGYDAYFEEILDFIGESRKRYEEENDN